MFPFCAFILTALKVAKFKNGFKQIVTLFGNSIRKVWVPSSRPATLPSGAVVEDTQ
jgi:hypothetical protein